MSVNFVGLGKLLVSVGTASKNGNNGALWSTEYTSGISQISQLIFR